MCIFEKQGKVDFRSPSVAKELIPVEDEFRLTKRLVVVTMSLVFATPVTVARSISGGDISMLMASFFK